MEHRPGENEYNGRPKEEARRRAMRGNFQFHEEHHEAVDDEPLHEPFELFANLAHDGTGYRNRTPDAMPIEDTR